MKESELSKAVQSLAARLNQDPGTPVKNATEAFWQDPPHPFANQQSERLPEDSDVVLIGSGITGISIAQHLLRLDPTLRIVMLEARTAISGATGRNGGHIKTVPFTDYYALKAELGRKSAMKITKFRLAHLDAIVKEAELLGKAGEVGLVRRLNAFCGIYDHEAWESAKKKLEAWFEDFPEERSNWTVHEGEAELKVRRFQQRTRILLILVENGPCERIRLHLRPCRSSVALSVPGSRSV